MVLYDSELRVLSTATRLAATHQAADASTVERATAPSVLVAAAAMDTRGRTHTGLGDEHTCPEAAVIAAAATAGAGPLVTIAAADGTGPRSPCPTCLQLILYHHPDALLVLPPGPDEPDAEAGIAPISALLPHSQRVPAPSALRVLRFHRRYVEAIATGRKTQTVRWNEAFAPGPALAWFEESQAQPLPVEITDVRTLGLDELTPEVLGLRRDPDVSGYVANLRRRYRHMPADAWVEVVTFRLRAGNPRRGEDKLDGERP